MTEKTVMSAAEKSLVALIMMADLTSGEKAIARELAKRSPDGKFKHVEDSCRIGKLQPLEGSYQFHYLRTVDGVEYKFEIGFSGWGRNDELIVEMYSARAPGIKKYKYDRNGFGGGTADIPRMLDDLEDYENEITKKLTIRAEQEAAQKEWRDEWRERQEAKKEETYQEIIQHYGRNKPKNFDELYVILKGFGNAKKIITAMDKLQPLMR